MYGHRIPSRHLNDGRFLLGLSLMDFSTGVGIFALTSKLLESTRFGLLSFVITLGFWVVLIPIRLKYRRKIIRDVLVHFLTLGRIK